MSDEELHKAAEEAPESSHEESGEEEVQVEDSIEERLLLARIKKEDATKEFKEKNFVSAADLYREAISALTLPKDHSVPEGDASDLAATCWSNIAACCINRKSAGEALHAIEQGLSLPCSDAKIRAKLWDRLAKVCIAKGDPVLATVRLQDCEDEGIKSSVQQLIEQKASELERADELLRNDDAAQAFKLFSKLEADVWASSRVTIGQLRSMAGLGEAARAFQRTGQLLRENPHDAALLTLRSEIQLSQCVAGPSPTTVHGTNAIPVAKVKENCAAAAKLAVAALQSDPENSEAKEVRKRAKWIPQILDEATKHFDHREFSESADKLETLAIELESKCYGMRQFIAVIRAEQGRCYLREKDYTKGLQYASRATSMDNNLAAAYLTKVQCREGQKDWARAEQELKQLLSWAERTDFLVNKYKAIQLEHKKSQRPHDLYELLGVSSIATAKEIKAAFRSKSRECHPDKLASLSEAEQKKGTERYLRLGQASEILSDETGRRMWDEGCTVEECEERMQQQKQARDMGGMHGGMGGFHGFPGGGFY